MPGPTSIAAGADAGPTAKKSGWLRTYSVVIDRDVPPPSRTDASYEGDGPARLSDDLDRIALTYGSAGRDQGVDPDARARPESGDVEPVMTRDGLQDGRITRQVGLRERRHHAPRRREEYRYLHLGAEDHGVSHPVVLDEARLGVDRHNHVRPESLRREEAFRSQRAKPGERGGRDEVQGSGVEERAGRHDRDRLVADGGAPRFGNPFDVGAVYRHGRTF